MKDSSKNMIIKKTGTTMWVPAVLLLESRIDRNRENPYNSRKTLPWEAVGEKRERE